MLVVWLGLSALRKVLPQTTLFPPRASHIFTSGLLRFMMMLGSPGEEAEIQGHFFKSLVPSGLLTKHKTTKIKG